MCSGTVVRYSFYGQGAHISGDMVVAFSADGRLAAAPDHNALRLWATDTGKTSQILEMPVTPRAFVLSADGSFASTGGVDRQIRVWDVRSERCLRTLEGHQTVVHRAALSRNGTLLATTDLGSAMLAWELAWNVDFPPDTAT